MPSPDPDRRDPADRLRRLLDRSGAEAGRGEAAIERRGRLAGRPDEPLVGLARDRSAPVEERAEALETLCERHRRDKTLSPLLSDLLDDPEERLARLAARLAPPFDPTLTAGLRDRLDDPREGVRDEAAVALARRKDPALLPRLTPWLLRGDPGRLRTALQCLRWLLPPEDRAELLARAIDRAPTDDPPRLLRLRAALEDAEAEAEAEAEP